MSASVLAQGSWVARSNFAGAAREKAAGFSIGTKGYIMGGNVSGNELWEWDQTLDSWTQRANCPVSKYFHVAFAIGTKGYVTTGSAPDTYEWDQSTNTWTVKAPYGGPSCTGAQAFVIGSLAYVGMGNAGGNDFWEYNSVTDSWTQRQNFGGAASHWGVGFSIGTKGYYGTGFDGNLNRQDFWEWDQATNIWTQRANFFDARRAAVGFALAGKGYIGTGYPNTYMNDWWEYDPAGNTWTQVANFGGPPSCCQATFVIGNKGYVGTGYANGGSQMFWEYTPGPSALNELSGLQVNIFPNPMETEALFTFSQPLKNGLLSVYSSDGRKLTEEIIPSGATHFTLYRKDVPSGIYLCKIMEGNKEVALKRVVVQ
ncbi:MAG: T9SS type A sorting domain-containing protein [Bacteroidia bacterium]|nr:T9SS type A sorting domain-containing protein [Bacteroidia bacterium]